MNKNERLAIELMKNTMEPLKTKGQLVVGRHLALAIHHSLSVKRLDRLFSRPSAVAARKDLDDAITRYTKWLRKLCDDALKKRLNDKHADHGLCPSCNAGLTEFGICPLDCGYQSDSGPDSTSPPEEADNAD